MSEQTKKDRDFSKMVMGIALPIMVQNGITSFVNLLDPYGGSGGYNADVCRIYC